MAHEMIHAYDYMRFKVDNWNLRHQACTEVCGGFPLYIFIIHSPFGFANCYKGRAWRVDKEIVAKWKSPSRLQQLTTPRFAPQLSLENVDLQESSLLATSGKLQNSCRSVCGEEPLYRLWPGRHVKTMCMPLEQSMKSGIAVSQIPDRLTRFIDEIKRLGWAYEFVTQGSTSYEFPRRCIILDLLDLVPLYRISAQRRRFHRGTTRPIQLLFMHHLVFNPLPKKRLKTPIRSNAVIPSIAPHSNEREDSQQLKQAVHSLYSFSSLYHRYSSSCLSHAYTLFRP